MSIVKKKVTCNGVKPIGKKTYLQLTTRAHGNKTLHNLTTNYPVKIKLFPPVDQSFRLAYWCWMHTVAVLLSLFLAAFNNWSQADFQNPTPNQSLCSRECKTWLAHPVWRSEILVSHKLQLAWSRLFYRSLFLPAKAFKPGDAFQTGVSSKLKLWRLFFYTP